MTSRTTLLDEAIEAWRDARFGFIDEVENIPADQFDYAPAEGMRSVRDLCVHILEVALFMTGELTRPDTDFRRQPFSDLIASYAQPAYELTTREQLLGMLRSQIDDGERTFREAGQLALMQYMTRFDGQQGTKFAWFQHGIAQEEYHRGQLTVYARTLGLVPALTKKIHGSGG